MTVRAVLDTQVVLRGLLGARRSACVAIYDALAQGAFTGVTSPHILDELRRVLANLSARNRYALTTERSTELLDAYQRIAEPVAGALVIRELAPRPAIPTEDEPVVAAAIEGGADHLVTDDAGLLAVKALSISGYRTLQITAPGPFVKQVLGIKDFGPP